MSVNRERQEKRSKNSKPEQSQESVHTKVTKVDFGFPTRGINPMTGDLGFHISVTILHGHWTSEHAAQLHQRFSLFNGQQISWQFKISEESLLNGYRYVFFGTAKE